MTCLTRRRPLGKLAQERGPERLGLGGIDIRAKAAVINLEDVREAPVFV
jgi:hypothetical protein